MESEFKDCRAENDGEVLCVSNSKLEVRFHFIGGCARILSLRDVRTGAVYGTSDAPDGADSGGVRRGFEVRETGGALEVMAVQRGSDATYVARVTIWPEVSAVEVRYEYQGRGEEDMCPLCILPLTPARHLRLTCNVFRDRSDTCGDFVTETQRYLYPSQDFTCAGSIFQVEDLTGPEKLTLVKDAPLSSSAIGWLGYDCRVSGTSAIELDGGGRSPAEELTETYGFTVGITSGSAPDEYRKYYRAACCHGAPAAWRPSVISNTWGDRKEGRDLCEAMVRAEIDAAADLGLDAVQLDAGWERGDTGTDRPDAPDLYDRSPDYWTPDPIKFPHGLRPLADYAASKGIAFGLWFVPDAYGEYAGWERDVQTILSLKKVCGATYFKFDGYDLTSKRAEVNFSALVEAIGHSDEDIRLDLDITAQRRLGYFYKKEQGNGSALFVENRYTDWVNYYPCDTLRAVWDLCRFIPGERLRFEVLNRSRNASLYGTDPFAPSNYTMDYLFAMTQPVNPLIWMTLSDLSDADAQDLRRAIEVYKSVRDDLAALDCSPVGDEPDGVSCCGFRFGSREGYLLLFSENAAESRGRFEIGEEFAGLKFDYEPLLSNAPKLIRFSRRLDHSGSAKVRFAAPNAYALIKYRVR